MPASMTAPERIETEDDLAAAVPVLLAREPRFQAVLERIEGLPLRRRPDGFGALLSAIVGQQVSTASAAAILGRLETAGFDDQNAVRAADDTELLACGLSRPKCRYVKALAEADLDYAGLRSAETEAVVSTLIALPGIGRWTAEIYAKFALGHTDAFAAGDLALQEAAKRLFGLPERPGERALRQMAEAWRPVRSVAARALWAYYRLETKREGTL